MAYCAVTFLLHRLSRLIDEEPHFYRGVEVQAESIRTELSWMMHNCVEYFDKKRDEHKRVEQYRRQIRDIVFNVEDAIDMLILKGATAKRRQIEVVSKAKVLDDVVKKIKGIKVAIEEMATNIEKFGIEGGAASHVDPTVEETRQRRKETSRKMTRATLLKQLIEGNSKFDVISITGMRGLGKTTLAREIYNNDAIKSRFNCRVWMSVSQNFRTRELLLQIRKCQMPKSDDLIRSLEDMSRDELKKKLLEYLRGKRYLIVMDDVWITEIWDEIRSAFPDDFNGSRILITSPIQEVTSHTTLNRPYSLPFINESESRKLVQEMELPKRYLSQFPIDQGRQIAQGLGIPLSILVLCGVLKGKTDRIWSKVIADVNWYHAQATTLRDDILDISYTHLPRNLKSCFMYLGAYPKDFEIPARQLIQLWIAEGLINCGGNEDIEYVAEKYLKELIHRNLIQVVERRSDGGAKTCHVHDLLRDLCISKGAEEKLSIQGSTLDLYMSSNTPGPSIARSLLFFEEDTYGSFDRNHWKWVQENFNLLRVLNFGNLYVYSIPTWIKRLIHLRYLRVQSDALKVLPASIGNLTNLETLDLRGTFFNCLPNGIWKLRHLRNLYMSGPAKLPNVRKLGIWFASNESNSEAGHALASVQHLHRLGKLKIINCSEILSLPNSFPETITKITLRQVCLLSSQLYIFGNMFPALIFLRLENLRIKEWKQGSDAMQNLRHLVIDRCYELTTLPLVRYFSPLLQEVEVLESNLRAAMTLKLAWLTFMITGPLAVTSSCT
ncbi:hypothetical protein CIPAW_07G136800 [Carya illinoinensis]|uniref:Uncharacterized protein n=1 Tax=Carya illinoinensis TaxID=32201 RepID=A0A8T1PUS5_CARIL|nr:hypothetical protein CIPAW_07G136800 [Carya illinoinensis]